MARMQVDKQPSAAITIQREYSYFSGINLSFLTRRNQPDCLRCINLHTVQAELQHCQLIIDRVVAGRGGRGALLFGGTACWKSAGRCRCSRRTGGGAPARRRCPLPPGSIRLAPVRPLGAEKPSGVKTEPVIRDSFNIDRFLRQWRNNIVFFSLLFHPR